MRPSSRVALSLESSLLRTFLKDSSLAALPLRTKDVDIPYFVQNFRLALLAYMEPAATHLTLPHERADFLISVAYTYHFKLSKHTMTLVGNDYTGRT